ncbi:uncharacterized protein [Montipora capricornis]|uniref:uncharacterized protein n=1 Tax=Montipora foliosa TaxID=591990 RepID=UPI0035F18B3B
MTSHDQKQNGNVPQSNIIEKSISKGMTNVTLGGGKQRVIIQSDDPQLTSAEEDSAIIKTSQSKNNFCRGLLLVWGCGEFGQHGHGHKEDVLCADALGSPLWLGQDRQVVKVACGSSHTLVLTDDNKIYGWGNSNSGQLGMGNSETNLQPRVLHLAVSSGTKLAGIACGTRHSFIWTQQGDCFSFGNNYSGQLGYDFRKPDFKENQLHPLFVDTLLHRQVSEVACGARHSVFLFTNGQVAAVGVNSRGQIGCGDTVDVVCPKTVLDLSPISVIACGDSHTLAADVGGHVYAWGYGKACGSKTDLLSPRCVYSSHEDDAVIDLAGGDSHSLILLSSGAVYSWGNNFEGQLGQGKIVKFVSEPREICHSLLPAKVVSIAVGETTCAAVTDDGELYMWGKNSSHVIRDDENSRFFQFEPRLVPLGVWRALKVSCGSWHITCVVSAPPKNNLNKSITSTVSFTASREACEVSALYTKPNQDSDFIEYELCTEDGRTMCLKDESCHCCDQGTFIGRKMNCGFNDSISCGELKDSGKQIGREDYASTFHDFELRFCGSDKRKDGLSSLNDSTNTYLLTDCDFEEKPSRGYKYVFKPDAHSNVDISEVFKGGITEEKEGIKSDAQLISEVKKDDIMSSTSIQSAGGVSRNSNNLLSCGQVLPKELYYLNLSTVADLEKPQELTCERNRKAIVEEKPVDTCPFSGEKDNRSPIPDVSLALRSRSLENFTFCYKSEGSERGSRQNRAFSTHASSVGHLNRERRPARMLRRTSSETEYHLPNQPVHTVDIGLPASVLQPHPPMDRTQSSPSLFSSNLIMSPCTQRKKRSLPAEPPRLPLVATVNDGSLPPRPPARYNRRFLQVNPVFSSATSWRKRK